MNVLRRSVTRNLSRFTCSRFSTSSIYPPPSAASTATASSSSSSQSSYGGGAGVRPQQPPQHRYDAPLHIPSPNTRRQQQNVMPRVGRRVPPLHDVDCVEADGVTVTRTSIADLQARAAWNLFLFLPSCFSSICPTEVKAISEQKEAFEKLNAQVFGVTISHPDAVKKWIDTSPSSSGAKGLKFPIICDRSQRFSKFSNAFNYSTSSCFRTTFITDNEGILSYFSTHPTTMGRSVDEMLRVLNGLAECKNDPQLTLPVDWKPKKESFTSKEAI